MTDDLATLRTRISELETTVRRLEARVAGEGVGGPPPSADGPPFARGTPAADPARHATGGEEDGAGWTRRQALVGGATAGVLGVAAVAGSGGTAAAADGDPLLIGRTNDGTSPTVLRTANDRATLIATDDFTIGVTKAALTGMANGRGSNVGVSGLSLDHSAADDGYGVSAEASREGSTTLVGKRSRAQLRIRPDGIEPADSAFSHHVGELVVDEVTDSLWYCAVAGTPGTWKVIAGPGVSAPDDLQRQINRLADVEMITPQRVYDSRFIDGKLFPGTSRLVSVRRGIDIETGAVVDPNLIPSSADAILFNIAAIETQVGGFLAVTPGNATEFSAASVNWFGDGQVLNNGTTSTISNREVRVWCGGLGGADFTIDVTGYVR